MTRGPVYDNAVRLLASTDLVALCHWLGIDATAESIRVSEALPAATLYADLLVRAGPGRLEHVEFVRAPPATCSTGCWSTAPASCAANRAPSSASTYSSWPRAASRRP